MTINVRITGWGEERIHHRDTEVTEIRSPKGADSVDEF
jgi:hypothetical protein